MEAGNSSRPPHRLPARPPPPPPPRDEERQEARDTRAAKRREPRPQVQVGVAASHFGQQVGREVDPAQGTSNRAQSANIRYQSVGASGERWPMGSAIVAPSTVIPSSTTTTANSRTRNSFDVYETAHRVSSRAGGAPIRSSVASGASGSALSYPQMKDSSHGYSYTHVYNGYDGSASSYSEPQFRRGRGRSSSSRYPSNTYAAHQYNLPPSANARPAAQQKYHYNSISPVSKRRRNSSKGSAPSTPPFPNAPAQHPSTSGTAGELVIPNPPILSLDDSAPRPPDPLSPSQHEIQPQPPPQQAQPDPVPLLEPSTLYRLSSNASTSTSTKPRFKPTVPIRIPINPKPASSRSIELTTSDNDEAHSPSREDDEVRSCTETEDVASFSSPSVPSDARTHPHLATIPQTRSRTRQRREWSGAFEPVHSLVKVVEREDAPGFALARGKGDRVGGREGSFGDRVGMREGWGGIGVYAPARPLMELVEPAKGRGLVQLAGSQRVWEDEFAAGRDRNKTRDESGSELGAKSGLESSVGPRTASSVFGEQRFPIMSAASVQLHVETAKPIRMASASPSEEIPYKQAEASSATLFGTPEFEERARMTSRPFGIEDEANGEGNTPTEDVADLSISVEAGQDEATNNENPQPEEATTDSIHCAKPVPAVPSRRGSAFLTSDSIDAPLEDSHDQETFELSDYDAVKTCASVFPEASPPAVPAPAITLALSESFLSSSEGRQRDTSPIDSATKQIPDATKKVQERKRNLSNVKIPMEPNSNPTAPASSNFFLVAPTPIKWTAEERIAIHRALTLTPLLPDLPARAHLPAPREALLAQIAPLLYNTLSNKSLPFESPASRKAVCWGALRARAASGTTCPVWMLSNRDYGSLIGRGDVALRRPLSRGALEGVVEAVSGGASGSSNMQSFEPNLLSKDGGKFLRSFHARNWLLTSWFGDAHAVWNMDEEKPFNRAPSVLLAGQVLPPTGVVDVSRDDQLVAVTYSNGSTYVWNIENSRLGESKLQPVSVLLHPEHTSNVYTQNRRVSALSFNASTGSYPFICAAYQDRVVFVDSRTKKHVHTQIMQPGACVTAAHWSEVHAHSVATGGADGLIRVWDLRRAGGPLHAFDDSKVEVAKLEWAPGCGGVLMAARKDGRITLYNAHRGYKFFTHEFHADLPLISAFWNEDPDYEGIVLSAANVDDGEDSVGTVQVWRSNAYIRERLALAS